MKFSELPFIARRFKLRIVYKSGYVHDVWVFDYDLAWKDGGLVKIQTYVVSNSNTPPWMAVGEVESVWVVGRLPGFIGIKWSG